jgi:flavin reductase (DIM6/NTAB) family NADH-FMN oxidoreductase RutF
LVTRVQQSSNTPPCVIVSVPKGQPLSPLIRDSRAFALCELAEGDLLLNRLFANPRDLHGDDPYLGLALLETPLGLPIPRCIASWVECELIRHMDIESDFEVYVGRAVGGGVLEAGKSKAAPPRRNGARRKTDSPTNKKSTAQTRVKRTKPQAQVAGSA